ncbi:MAG: hypothetical protein EXX96DRAFT_499138 [Benjaminiella poitrasii]|nr:MAG: hypothetical protein EXX96DRAFT_499138 [Benjaminiella poitrasii]
MPYSLSMIIPKLLAITFILNLAKPSLQSTFKQDDALSLPRYKVYVTKERISNADINLAHNEKNSVIMTSALGQPFSCIIPDVQIEQERLEREKLENSKVETEEDKKRIIEKGLDLLEPLENNCIQFYAHTSQYWTHEYCHNQYVRQFHVERSHDGKEVKEHETASFYLGFHPSVASNEGKKSDNKELLSKKRKATPRQVYLKAPTELRKMMDSEERYLAQAWKGGSVCDLTGKPRTVEVQYRCDSLQGQDYVSSFVETSTCNYQLVISTPRLCEEMNLSRRHHVEPHRIKCRPIVSEKLIEQEQTIVEDEPELHTDEDATTLSKQEENEHEQIDESQENILLKMISELTEQINELKLQVNNDDTKKTNVKKMPLLTLDEQGNIVLSDMSELLLGLDQSEQQQQQQQIPVAQNKKNKANRDQDKNSQAYHQKYFIAE